MKQQTSGQKHPYHLVDPSPWPLLGSLAAGVFAGGAILAMHYKTYWVFWLGLGLIALTMIVWWRDVVIEAFRKKLHTPVVQIGLRYGMALFIASEVMFFAAFFWAFFSASLFPTEAMGGTWPPKGIETIPPFGLPYLNTLILLTSGTTVTWAHHAIREGNQKDAVRGLLLTVVLGLCFTAVQAYEYMHAHFGLSDGIYGSTFYLATGFHGLHVLIGTIFLIVCLFRTMAGQFTADRHFGLEAAAWYWHFVDVVWLFLFVCVYWWGS